VLSDGSIGGGLGGCGSGVEARAGGIDVGAEAAAPDTGHCDGGAGANPIKRRIS
jgi:hypothetical protein